jgi:hypothetical protein
MRLFRTSAAPGNARRQYLDGSHGRIGCLAHRLAPDLRAVRATPWAMLRSVASIQMRRREKPLSISFRNLHPVGWMNDDRKFTLAISFSAMG